MATASVFFVICGGVTGRVNRHGQFDRFLRDGNAKWALTSDVEYCSDVVHSCPVEGGITGRYLVICDAAGEFAVIEMGDRNVGDIVDIDLDDIEWRAFVVSPANLGTESIVPELDMLDVYTLTHGLPTRPPNISITWRDEEYWVSLVHPNLSRVITRRPTVLWVGDRTFTETFSYAHFDVPDPPRDITGRFRRVDGRWVLNIRGIDEDLVEDSDTLLRLGDAPT